MKKVNEMSHNELIEEVEKLRCERDMYKNLNRTHVEKVNNITKELGKISILTHEVDHYKGLTNYYVKLVNRQMERLQEFTELNLALKTQKEEVEKENNEIKAKIEINKKYGVIHRLEEQVFNLTLEKDNYKDIVDMKKKQITRMTYRIEELENENETLKYNLDETAKKNYEIKKRCNDLSYDLAEIRNYCDSVLNDEDEEEE